MSRVKIAPYSEVTDEQIAGWRVKYPKTTVIGVETDSGEDAHFVIRPLTRDETYRVAQYGVDKEFAKANRYLIKNCVLGGDVDELEDDTVMFAVIAEINALSEKKQSKIVKR